MKVCETDVKVCMLFVNFQSNVSISYKNSFCIRHSFHRKANVVCKLPIHLVDTVTCKFCA